MRYYITTAIDYVNSRPHLGTAYEKVTADVIARYDPRTEEWLLLPLPQAETDVRRIEVDQNNPNRVWWSSVAYQARLGYVELLE